MTADAATSRQRAVFMVAEHCPARLWTHWSLPMTGVVEIVLVHETRILVTERSFAADQVRCRPERYHRMELGVVSFQDRHDPHYRGYSLVIERADFDEKLIWWSLPR
jgi:hypothetical protein